MKEREQDEVYFENDLIIKVVPRHPDTCIHCVYWSKCCDKIKCSAKERTDGTSVIFIEQK